MYPTISISPSFHFNQVTGKAKERFNPSRYPLKLSLYFSKQQTGLKDYLKEKLDRQRKSEIRYRVIGKYINNFEIYGMDVLSFNPIINALGHTQIEMWERRGLGEDKRIHPEDLYQEGQNLFKQYIEATPLN